MLLWHYKDAARCYWQIEARPDPDGPATADTESWWVTACRSEYRYNDPKAPVIWGGYVEVPCGEQPSLVAVLDELAAHWARLVVGLATHARKDAT